MKKNGTRVSMTVFDSSPTLLNELKKQNINILCKIVASPENQKLFQKYGAAVNSLVICAPNGDKLMQFNGEDCSQSKIVPALKDVKAAYVAWQGKK